MQAETDAPTIVNLVNHTYWNLSAGGSPTIAEHTLTVDADHYLPAGDGQIPTGEMRRVEGTAFDLNSARRIGDGLDRLAAEGDPIGFDHALCLRDGGDSFRFAARLFDPLSGRGFDLSTNQPAVQVYAGGKLGPSIVGKGSQPIAKFGGLGLETEGFPNAPNASHFPSSRLDPGERYLHRMALSFFVA
jgi:aldose 1-epimerase